jgi:hypothetical protein
MTDAEQFQAILQELHELLLDLGDLAESVMLIGGQVLALESIRRGGSGVIEATTDAGVIVERGFSLEPDLLFDLDEDSFMAERVPEVLRARSYVRGRDFRWSKQLGGSPPMVLHVDLFAPARVSPEALPTAMTPLPDADLATRYRMPIEVQIGAQTLRIYVPEPVAFIAMKITAKTVQRPNEQKDSFDLYAYVNLMGPKVVNASLDRAGVEGQRLRRELRLLFWDVDSRGTRDVVAASLLQDSHEQQLLARAVVDLMAEISD